MKIEVNLFASFRKYLPGQTKGHTVYMDLDQGATISQVMARLNIPSELPKIIFINGIIVQPEAILNEGDRAGIFPLLAGG